MNKYWPIKPNERYADVKGIALGLAITFVLGWLAYVIHQVF